jgi:hypothetical protein
MNDVLVLISRTDFDPNDDEQWAGIWEGYCYGGSGSRTEWSAYDFNSKEDEDKFRSISIKLWKTGRLHQPRQFGARPSRRSEYWLEAVLPDSELESRPAVKDAWDKFQMVAGLTNLKLDRTYS